MPTLDGPALNALRARARRDVDAGLEFGGVEGCSFAIAHDGEILWEEGFGRAKADTPILLFSITKTVFESALWMLNAQGLHPDTPVVEIIPEFMGGTRPEITIAMVETHLGGFAWHPLDYPAAAQRATRVAAMSHWRLERDPGFYEYHPANAGWVLSEIVDRVSGQDYRDFLRTRVLEPLGLSGSAGIRLGAPENELTDVLLHRSYIGGYTPDPSLREPMPYGLASLAGLSLGTPGAGAVGTAAGVALLYQAYLHNSRQLWNPTVLSEARDMIRVDMPDPTGKPMLRSRSFVHAGSPEHRYGERTFFGPGVSAHAFGHQGQGGQIAWADPASGLSFAYLTNTVVFPPGGTFHSRSRELSALAARVLGEAGRPIA